jgi:TRAP transporter TAXI family solute receptor
MKLPPFPVRRYVGAILLLAVTSALPAAAQLPPSIFRSEAEQKTLNANKIGIVTGFPGGTYNRMGVDLATVLDDRSPTTPFRVVVMNTVGSVRNLDDLLNLRGVDVAIVQSDVLEAFRANARDYEELGRKMRYITPLHREEIHILAGGGISGIMELDRRRVNIGPAGSGTQITARNMLDRLHINPIPDESTPQQAREKLLKGEIDAMIYVVGKAADFFRSIKPQEVQDAHLRFVALGSDVAGLDQYLPAKLGAEDYPSLVFQDQPVATRAVVSVMAVYAFDPKANAARYIPLRQFVERFLEHAPQLIKGGFSPSWCQVDLMGEVPGWSRFDAAQSWLQGHRAAPTRLCAVSGSTCTCPASRDTLCEERFRKESEQQGVSISDLSRPGAQTLFEAWKRAHPGDC